MFQKIKLRKITLPLFAAIIFFYISTLFLLGAIVGYIFIQYSAEKIKKPIQISFGNYKIHLHHWIYVGLSLIVILISGVNQFLPIFILGFGGGMVFQGIYCYNDWYKIIYKK